MTDPTERARELCEAAIKPHEWLTSVEIRDTDTVTTENNLAAVGRFRKAFPPDLVLALLKSFEALSYSQVDGGWVCNYCASWTGGVPKNISHGEGCHAKAVEAKLGEKG